MDVGRRRSYACPISTVLSYYCVVQFIGLKAKDLVVFHSPYDATIEVRTNSLSHSHNRN